MGHNASNLLYLVTIVTFIWALRDLSNPARARRGVWVGAAGMALAIATTFGQHGLHRDISISLVLSALIGSISFSGSMIAFAKLQELIGGRPITYAGQQVVNAVVFLGALAAGIALVAGVQVEWLLWALVGAALVFGVLFVLPI